MKLVRMVVALVVAGAAGCVDEAVLGSTRWVTEFEYMRRGGDCETPEGTVMCELRVVVRDDGTWSATGVPEPPSGGAIPPGSASALASIFGQSWRVFTDVEFQGVCPTRTGGEEYGYALRRFPYGPGSESLEPRIQEVRSCVYDLERYDALVKRNQIEVGWLVIKPPELEHVEFR